MAPRSESVPYWFLYGDAENARNKNAGMKILLSVFCEPKGHHFRVELVLKWLNC